MEYDTRIQITEYSRDPDYAQCRHRGQVGLWNRAEQTLSMASTSPALVCANIGSS